jgi:hypothetical protein
MRSKFFVYCNRASTSANRLAEALGGVRIKRVGSKYRQKKGDVVINYGCSDCGDVVPTLQKPYSVHVASSKMATFDALHAAGLPIPMYTKSKKQAQEWASVGKILGRDLDRGSQGRGISVYKKGEKIGDHLFYVKFMNKDREFRFHVVNGKVVHTAEKLRVGKEKRGDNYDKYIRSHNRGWVLAFHHLADNPPPELGGDLACRACTALGLSFGAVDMGWHEDTGWFILEVNTAPGIEETTLDAYAKAIKENW